MKYSLAFAVNVNPWGLNKVQVDRLFWASLFIFIFCSFYIKIFGASMPYFKVGEEKCGEEEGF